ncbi:MAG TPA: hypothetical protein DCL21_07215, partial [Alphaproteobacteria bacterium]|nr:hypothetical protein [Alphaproteobacteria bacterium]
MTVNLKLSEQAEKIFNGAIQQDLASLESLRLEKVKESNKRKKQVCTLGIPVFLLVIVLGLLINADEALIGISLAFAIYFLVYIIKPEDQFKEEYLKIFKDKFVKSFFAQLFN